MKKIFLLAFIVAIMASFASGKGLNLKREACDKACTTTKEECYKKAKDKKGKINDVKKAACDTAFKKCTDKCKKDYPDK